MLITKLQLLIMTTLLASFTRGFQQQQQQLIRPSSSLRIGTRLLLSTSATSINNSFDDDTIFALSSGQATGPTAVAVIRLSGPQSHSILERLTPHAKTVPTRKAVVRKLLDPFSSNNNKNKNKNNQIDQALVLKFDAPHSFTGEDVVEFHSHGSRAVVREMLRILSEFPGARMAEKGEFTQRAFAGGKLDLLEVEALADLLTADTQSQRLQALNQLDGKLSDLYQNWRTSLTKGLAHAEAVIDFGDDEHLGDDDDEVDYEKAQASVWGTMGEAILNLKNDMKDHLADNQRGELVREGLQIAICGPPNAGKSSLFNILAQRDAAIVSPIQGTTRDVLQVTLELGGVKCILSDTAGVRDETSDLIEQEGIKRARTAARQADVVVAMIDGTDVDEGIQALGDIMEDEELLSRLVLVINKLDLVPAKQKQEPSTLTATTPKFYLSCETSEGVDSFLDSLAARVVDRVSSSEESGDESPLITRARHRQHVEGAVEALERFGVLSQEGSYGLDLAAEELRLAASELGRITGAVDVEDVLDVLFADFCIGK